MSIRESLSKYLTDHGLWPDEAQSVIDQYISLDTTVDYIKEKIGSSLDGYPPSVMACLRLAVRAEAVRWIDENKPKHFARMVLSIK